MAKHDFIASEVIPIIQRENYAVSELKSRLFE